jgi:hypothetical protein
MLGPLKEHVGQYFGKSFTHLLVDSYEAGNQDWTDGFREKFQEMHGYDPLPVLAIVSTKADHPMSKKFQDDRNATISRMFIDNGWKTTKQKISEAGLKMFWEPYWGPFSTEESLPIPDLPMTEFWTGGDGRIGGSFVDIARDSGKNIIGAEAFTGRPELSHYTEDPAFLKKSADGIFVSGINLLFLHHWVHQPFDDRDQPGMGRGWWGTHFGRNQTWARSGKGWFDALTRCPALLQWGEPSTVKIVGHGITPRGTFLSAQCRAADGTYVFFVMNHSDHPASMNMGLPDVGKAPEWFDPVTGRIVPLELVNGRVPVQLAPCGSGFLVLRKPAGTLAPSRESGYVQFLRKPLEGKNAIVLSAPWRVTFGERIVDMAQLADWTKSDDPHVRYFSGTATYRTSFTCDGRSGILSLGDCNGQIARVVLNGRDLGTLWCEPYEILLPEDAAKDGENVLEIEFTNVWANRLIGDEQEPADCDFAKAPYPGGQYLTRFPDWFSAGMAARPSKGRKCFTDWNYFTKDSPLAPSGLLGPVRLFPEIGPRRALGASAFFTHAF